MEMAYATTRAITRMLARIAALAGTVVPGCVWARARRTVHRTAMIVLCAGADKRRSIPANGLFPLRRTLLCCRQIFGARGEPTAADRRRVRLHHRRRRLGRLPARQPAVRRSQ